MKGVCVSIRRHAITIEGSGHIQQDTWGSAASVTWVLDGATRWTNAKNERVARWVRALSDALADAVTASPGEPLTTLLNTAIGAAREEPGEWHPSATVALVRHGADGIEYLVLADSGIMTPTSDDGAFTLVQDPRPDLVGSEIRAGKRRVTAPPGHHGALNTLALADREVDYWRNRDGGFWVAHDNPAAAHEALTGTLPGAHEVLLMTDGVCNEIDRAFESRADAWERLTTDLDGTVAELRRIALERDGKVDDMTAVWVGRRPE